MDLLSKIGIKKRFRDPIYGYIWLTSDEVEIVDTPLFQRLRRIQQLALTKYVYPTAEHSRFVHSLGVLQAATNIFLWIHRNYAEQLKEMIPGEDYGQYLKILRFAALLHDIGHLPFSHGAEEELFTDGITHEKVGSYLIQNYDPISKVIKRSDIKPEEVGSLISGTFIRKFEIIQKIISGEFDADRADYLRRDSYFCGVAYGNYDYDRYIMSFKLHRKNNDSTYLAVDEGNVSVLESFLLARFHYSMQVLHHRTRVGYDLALQRYFRDLKDRNKLPELITKGIETLNIDGFIDFDDYTIFHWAKEDTKLSNIWADFLLRKKHLVPILDRSMGNENDKILYKDLVIKLEDDKNFNKHDDFFTFSKNVPIHRIVHKTDEINETSSPQNNNIIVLDKKDKKIGDLTECSPLIKKFSESPVHIFRVYSTPQKSEAALLKYKETCDIDNRRKQIS